MLKGCYGDGRDDDGKEYEVLDLKFVRGIRTRSANSHSSSHCWMQYCAAITRRYRNNGSLANGDVFIQVLCYMGFYCRGLYQENI